jgi:hypothetical protein
MKLEVQEPANRAAVLQDPGAGPPQGIIGGYAGHYCGVPQQTDPGIVACSMIMSGLRVFDIRDPYHPREIAYFNSAGQPGTGDPDGVAFAMSRPTFAPERGEIWYADGNSGFYVVQVTNGVWPFTSAQQPLGATTTTATASTAAGSLSRTGAAVPLLAAAVLLAGAVGVRRLRVQQ